MTTTSAISGISVAIAVGDIVPASVFFEISDLNEGTAANRSKKIALDVLVDYINPMTAAGDLIVGGASGALTRKAIGTAGQVLRVNDAGTALVYDSNLRWNPAGEWEITGFLGFKDGTARIWQQYADAGALNFEASDDTGNIVVKHAHFWVKGDGIGIVLSRQSGSGFAWEATSNDAMNLHPIDAVAAGRSYATRTQYVAAGDPASYPTGFGTIAGHAVGGDENVSGVYRVNDTQVIGAQGALVANATGGAIVDTEARAALNALLARCRAHGLIAT